MPRIPRVRGLQPFTLALSSSSASPRTPFAASRAISTTSTARSKNTEWVRGKLWKGDAPGPKDPYTQRPEPEDPSNLPEEALEYRPREDKTPRAVRESRLALPPRRTEAMNEADVAAADPTYVPAESLTELEEIASLSTWWEQPGHWDEVSQFKGFGSAEKILDKDVVEVYMRRAVVEVLALQQAGSFDEWATRKWNEGSRSELDQALAVEVQIQGGKATLKGDASAVASSLISEASADAVERISVDEAAEMVKAWEPSWKDLVLDDKVKFALRKRLYQLTGTLIPDAKLGAARTVRHVLTIVSKPPQAQKLAQILEGRSDLHELANVKVHSHKIGAIDKEIAVGRWKVIEEELRKRELPVTGHEGLAAGRERDFLKGKR